MWAKIGCSAINKVGQNSTKFHVPTNSDLFCHILSNTVKLNPTSHNFVKTWQNLSGQNYKIIEYLPLKH